MEKDIYKIEEYKRLTREIESNTKRIFHIISIIFPVSAGVIGYCLTEDIEFYWTFFPNIILIPTLFIISSQVRSTSRIATYISIVYENKNTGIFWENRLDLMRQGKKYKSKYYVSISWIIISIGIISFIIAGVKLSIEGFECLYVLLYLSLLILCAIGYIFGSISIREARNTKSLKRTWKELIK